MESVSEEREKSLEAKVTYLSRPIITCKSHS